MGSQQTPDSKFKCNLTIEGLGITKPYISDAKASAKEAKQSAASKALSALKSKIDVAMKKHLVAKAEKEAAWEAKVAEKRALEESVQPGPPGKKAKAKAKK